MGDDPTYLHAYAPASSSKKDHYLAIRSRGDMKIATIFTTILLAVGWSICPTVGFVPGSFLAFCGPLVNGMASKSCETIVTHQQMTKNAIYQVADEVLRANPNPRDRLSSQRLSALTSLDESSLITAYYGPNSNRNKRLFKDAVDRMRETTAAVDYFDAFGGFGERKLAPAHFDGEQFESGQNRLIALRLSVVSLIKSGDYDAARKDTGRMFHTLQDFYSHSNWIENGNQAPNPVLGQPGQRIENVASPTQQTCLDNCVLKRGKYSRYLLDYYDCHDNIVESLKINRVLTSGYTSGSHDNEGKVIKKPYGKCSHGGISILEYSQNLPARGGINKDSPYAAVSPHYYLHKKAAEVAEQATIEMLRDLRRDVDNDLLFGAYLGVFENPAEVSGIDGNWVHYLRQKWNRNAMMQRHWSRIEGSLARHTPQSELLIKHKIKIALVNDKL